MTDEILAARLRAIFGEELGEQVQELSRVVQNVCLERIAALKVAALKPPRSAPDG